MNHPAILSTRSFTISSLTAATETLLGVRPIPLLITEIGQELSPSGRFTFNLESSLREERLFSDEIRDDLVLPSSAAAGRRSFKLYGSGFYVPAGDVLRVWTSDRSGADNTVRIYVKGTYITEELPPDVDLTRQHVTYWSDSLTVAANTTLPAFMRVKDDFILRAITLVATGDLVLGVRSRKRNDQLWATGLRLNSIAPSGGTTSERPFMVVPGFLFPQGDTIEISATDRTGSTNTVLAAFHGETPVPCPTHEKPVVV